MTLPTHAVVTRSLAIPDRLRVERCQRVPELGPRILFFSGGSALAQVSRVLKGYTHNSIHLVTPFDSGGSSARLREAFEMPSVGDLRNRLMSLADETATANRATYALFSHRLPMDAAPRVLHAQLDRMVRGTDPLVRDVPDPLRRIVRTHLRHFAERVPGDFDLRGASIGNLLLAGGYLANEGDIDSVLYLFSKLVQARGTVRPTVTDSLHLCARYDDGSTRIGQHRMTGKEESPPDARLQDLWLVRSLRGDSEASTSIDPPVRELILGADLICFPMGSFFSSVAANLLPVGVGGAIVETPCPKVYVPNAGTDPEQRGYSVAECVDKLVALVQRDVRAPVRAPDVVQLVIVDADPRHYPDGIDEASLRAKGIQVLKLPLLSGDANELDPRRVTEALITLA